MNRGLAGEEYFTEDTLPQRLLQFVSADRPSERRNRFKFQRFDGWEVGWQAGDDELADLFGAAHILQAVSAQVFEGNPLRQIIAHQGSGGLGEQHLTAVTRACDACGAVDVYAFVIVDRHPGLTGVQSHAHQQPGILGTGVRFQSTLHVDDSCHGIVGTWEGDEEAVSLRAHFRPMPPGDGLAYDAVVVVHQCHVILPQVLDQFCGTLNVCK
jgi:hypothetical protein